MTKDFDIMYFGTYHIITYGCQMNKRDSEIMSSLLDSAGYSYETNAESADLLIFNTCSVRENAEQRLCGKVNSLRSLKQKRPEMIIAIAGCTPQKHGRNLLDKMPNVDLVIGTHVLYRLPELVAEARSRGPIVCVDDTPRPMISQSAFDVRAEGVTAWVSIMEGCDNRCAYCVVPDTRGPERSRPANFIVDEVRAAVAAGHVEIILLGQNVNSYGRGLDEQIDFAELLARLDKVEGVRRLRFATSHPKDLSERLIDAMASLDHVCEHIHLALQSGSNRILDLMGRGYTIEKFERLVDQLRTAMPNVGIMTDIIVGFPGETETDFEATCTAVERIGFDGAYIFKYSDRPGTRAENMPGHIDQTTIKRRHADLLDLQKSVSRRHVNAAVGQVCEVLVETVTDDGLLKGRTRNYKVATIRGSSSLVGQEVMVRVTGINGYTLDCEMLPSTVLADTDD